MSAKEEKQTVGNPQTDRKQKQFITVSESQIEYNGLYQCRRSNQIRDPALVESFKSGQVQEVRLIRSPTDPTKFIPFRGHQALDIQFHVFGVQYVEAILEDITPLEALKKSLHSNFFTPITPLEYGRYFKTLLSQMPDMFPDYAAISSFFNLSEPRISQFIAHAESIDGVKQNLSSDNGEKVEKAVKESVGRSLQKIPKPEVKAAAYLEVAEKKLTRNQTEILAVHAKEPTATTESVIAKAEEIVNTTTAPKAVAKKPEALFSQLDDAEANTESLLETAVIIPEDKAEKALEVLQNIEGVGSEVTKKEAKRFFTLLTDAVFTVMPEEMLADAFEIAESRFRRSA